ncbi:MAG: ATP-binding protein [Anaerolineae bacterium]|nr:ATP-binding protein [Anaerolineae bacterium]MCI0608050.1 ATP-binding protein [Anaerolineae bacterium]
MDLIRPTIIIVTGRPAAGKSTLAKWLAQELKLSLVSKDSIREVLFDRLGWKDREWAQVLGKASIDIMFYFAQAELAVGHSIIMDNSFHPPISTPRFKTLKEQYKAQSIQIVCNSDRETLFQRFKARAESGNRHLGHGDKDVLKELYANLADNSSLVLEIGSSIIEVDTTDFAKVDYQEIMKSVKPLLAK